MKGRFFETVGGGFIRTHTPLHMQLISLCPCIKCTFFSKLSPLSNIKQRKARVDDTAGSKKKSGLATRSKISIGVILLS